MSIGLFRVLLQQKLIPQEKVSKYQQAAENNSFLQTIFNDKIITPKICRLCCRACSTTRSLTLMRFRGAG